MTTDNSYIRLDPTERVDGRPFSDPEKNAEDLIRLQHMRNQLDKLLSKPESLPNGPRPIVLHFRETDGRRCRIAISQLDDLLSGAACAVVGFFGEKRSGADSAPLDAIDADLIREFPRYPDVMSYSSIELMRGAWCNLVLLRRPGGMAHWSTNAKHAYAAHELAPSYYQTIRLHNGVLPGGVRSDGDLRLLTTKYYDFRGDKAWLAVREM